MAVFVTIPEGVCVCVILLDLCIGMYVCCIFVEDAAKCSYIRTFLPHSIFT